MIPSLDCLRTSILLLYGVGFLLLWLSGKKPLNVHMQQTWELSCGIGGVLCVLLGSLPLGLLMLHYALLLTPR